MAATFEGCNSQRSPIFAEANLKFNITQLIKTIHIFLYNYFSDSYCWNEKANVFDHTNKNIKNLQLGYSFVKNMPSWRN